MEHRDYLKDQIDQIARIFGKVLFNFLGLKANGNAAQGILISNQRLQSELDINIDELLALNNSELIEFIRERQYTVGHLETLSEYFKEVGIIKIVTNQPEARIWLEKAIALLDIADKISKTMSFNRINKKSKIKQLLPHD